MGAKRNNPATRAKLAARPQPATPPAKAQPRKPAPAKATPPPATGTPVPPAKLGGHKQPAPLKQWLNRKPR